MTLDETYKGHTMWLGGSSGYPAIWINGHHRYVHRLVYEDSHGSIPEGYIVHHKDGNPLNYSPDNLEAMTYAEHAQAHGMIGNQNSLGHHHNKETRQKISRALAGNQNSLGHHPSKEARQKISQASKAWWAKRKATANG